MTNAPESLRDSQEHTQIGGKDRVARPAAEEGRVDEIMGYGVGVPPHAQGDEPDRRPQDQQTALDEGQSHKQAVPARSPHDLALRAWNLHCHLLDSALFTYHNAVRSLTGP